MFPSSGCGAGRLVLDMAKPVAVRCYTTYSYEGERSSVRTVGHFSCPVFCSYEEATGSVTRQAEFGVAV